MFLNRKISINQNKTIPHFEKCKNSDTILPHQHILDPLQEVQSVNQNYNTNSIMLDSS